MFLHFLNEKAHKRAFMDLAHAVANADGFVSGNEMRYLQAVGVELGLDEAIRVVAPIRELSDIVGEIRDTQLRHLFFAEILLLVYADGNYSDDEKEIVMELKRMFEISDETYEHFRTWAIEYDRLKIQGMQLILNDE